MRSSDTPSSAASTTRTGRRPSRASSSESCRRAAKAIGREIVEQTARRRLRRDVAAPRGPLRAGVPRGRAEHVQGRSASRPRGTSSRRGAPATSTGTPTTWRCSRRHGSTAAPPDPRPVLGDLGRHDATTGRGRRKEGPATGGWHESVRAGPARISAGPHVPAEPALRVPRLTPLSAAVCTVGRARTAANQARSRECATPTSSNHAGCKLPDGPAGPRPPPVRGSSAAPATAASGSCLRRAPKDHRAKGITVNRAAFRVWDDDACRLVHEASLSLLVRTGVEMKDEGARGLCAGAGAAVDGRRVRLPAALVAAARSRARRAVGRCARAAARQRRWSSATAPATSAAGRTASTSATPSAASGGARPSPTSRPPRASSRRCPTSTSP